MDRIGTNNTCFIFLQFFTESEVSQNHLPHHLHINASLMLHLKYCEVLEGQSLKKSTSLNKTSDNFSSELDLRVLSEKMLPLLSGKEGKLNNLEEILFSLCFVTCAL